METDGNGDPGTLPALVRDGGSLGTNGRHLEERDVAASINVSRDPFLPLHSKCRID